MAGVLGIISALLILIRIIDPPTFGTIEPGLTEVGTIKTPIYLALAAAVGIAVGSFLAIEEERLS